MFSRIQSTLLRARRWVSRSEWAAARRAAAGASAATAHEPGLLLIQIDGLARTELERALKKRRMPFLRRLLRRGGYRAHTFYPGQPATTPAVQGELHYGVRAAVPSFSFLDRRTGKIGMMMEPTSAKRIEADLAARSEGLLKGGSSWSNIYTGGATQHESHFCGASIGLGDMWREGKLRTIFTFAFLYFPSFVRLVALLLIELGLGVWDAARGSVARFESARKEFIFIIPRVFVCLGLREMITLGVKIDLARGMPVIHVNFLGYDEQSHRRGPDSAFAHWTLRGIDRAIRQLYAAARRSGRRDYEVWIFSDHGQIRSHPIRRTVPGGLEELVRRHWEGAATGAPVRSQRRPSPAGWLGGPRRDRRVARQERDAELSAFEQEEFAVACMGPVGHIYFAREIGRDRERRLAAALVADGVPGVLLRRDDGKIDWLTAGGEFVLPDHAEVLPHEPRERAAIAEDLVGLCANPHAGDLVVLGWAPDGTAVTFADENGAHAGPSPAETRAFALLPAHVRIPEEAPIFRPEVLRKMALRRLGRIERKPRRSRRAEAARPEEKAALRVATYNAHGCIGLDGRVSPARIATVLEHADADLIALQEIDSNRRRSRGEDQLVEIAGRLGLEYCYCPAVSVDGAHYGHGILSRVPMTVMKRGRLPDAGRAAEPREALWVRLEWGGRPLNFIATHLGLGVAERRAQVAALLGSDWLGAVPEGEVAILAGDFNLTAGHVSYRRMAIDWHDVQAHAPNHQAARTFPSFMPLRRIDHIFVSPSVSVEAVRVIRDDFTAVASDHLPLIADLLLPPRMGARPRRISGGVRGGVSATS